MALGRTLDCCCPARVVVETPLLLSRPAPQPGPSAPWLSAQEGLDAAPVSAGLGLLLPLLLCLAPLVAGRVLQLSMAGRALVLGTQEDSPVHALAAGARRLISAARLRLVAAGAARGLRAPCSGSHNLLAAPGPLAGAERLLACRLLGTLRTTAGAASVAQTPHGPRPRSAGAVR